MKKGAGQWPAPQVTTKEKDATGQSYQRLFSEGTNIISFAYLFFE
jgi:hypothetical protein